MRIIFFFFMLCIIGPLIGKFSKKNISSVNTSRIVKLSHKSLSKKGKKKEKKTHFGSQNF